uniref:HD-Zip IV transcription factor GL9 n=1 Tax=Triticum aestivum TaxID=4565 RepID=F8TTC5_WHEAT|nr:HD-Zip IV transcription factor GL9 [Triticum aestivum]
MPGNRGGRRRKAGRRARDNELDIPQSNSDGHDGAEGSQPKRRLQRLNPQQTQVLEGFFSICAHPDENQRMGLSESTGLSMQQVKFWFQNKRTYMKHLTGKEESYRMKAQNEMLREENKRLASAAKASFCPSCVALPGQNPSVEVQRLKEENESLRQQVSQLRAEAHQLDPSTVNIIGRENDIDAIAELVQNAMHEFVVLSESGGPLWMPVPGGSLDLLNKVAYAQTFGARSSANAIGFRVEATRADGMVMMEAKQIVDYIMDSECYTSFCPGTLTSAKTTKIYKWPTNAGYNGAMHLMTAETVFPSPLVPSRKCTFVRCCRGMQNGTVIIVDVSLDNGDGTFFKCRKMPSGLLIRSLNSDASQVTVIEHVQVNDAGVHELYRPTLSGLMFGARRWLSSIERQSARMRDLFLLTQSTSAANMNGRKTLMKIADDLLAGYANGIAAVPGGRWTILRGAGTEDDIRVTYRRKDDDDDTAVVSVCAAFHLPLPLRMAFDLLRNIQLRPKWDVLVNGNSVREEVAVCKGVGGFDDVSILHIKHNAENNENIMILQNSGYDVSGAFMIYCPVDIQLMNEIMSPSDMGESNKVSLYPTGFSLLPVDDSALGLGEGGATLVTAGYQILLKLARGTGLYPRSVSTAVSLMTENIATIRKTLTNSHPIFYKKRQSPNNLG